MTGRRVSDAQRRHTYGPLQPLDGYARRSAFRLSAGFAGLLFVIALVPVLLWLIAEQIETSSLEEMPGGRSPERRPASLESKPGGGSLDRRPVPVNTMPVNGVQVP